MTYKKLPGLTWDGTVYENDLKGDCDEFYTIENFWSYFVGHVGVCARREA